MRKRNKKGQNKDRFQFVEMNEKNLEITKTISLDEIQEKIDKLENKNNSNSEKNIKPSNIDNSSKKEKPVEEKKKVVIIPSEKPVEEKKKVVIIPAEKPVEEKKKVVIIPAEEPPKENNIEENINSEEKEESVSIEEKPIDTEVKIEENEKEEKPVTLNEKENVVENAPEIKEQERVNRLKKKFHFSFEVRVTIMVICILLLFASACLLIIETIRSGKNEVVHYNETSTVSYNVCLLPNETYHQECLEENMEYLASLTNTIGAYFQYKVDLSTEITYDLAYHVAAITKIYDSKDSSKVLYRTEETIVDRKELNDINSLISLDTDVTIDYQRYYSIVKDYQERYALDSVAEVEIVLYLDETTETRKVASLIIPLGKDTYHIKKDVLSNKNQSVEIDGDFWNEYNIMCAVVASVLILISLFLLYQTTKLVLKVTVNHNKYQQKLSQLLRDYDRIIVIARDGYASNIERSVVKVDSFEELLAAQETLQKPVIYSRVNDVKSEFIVEDEKTLYKYVLKESDL